MKNINDFLKENQNSTITILKDIKESRFVAIIGYDTNIGKIATVYNGEESNLSNLRFGVLNTDWYPIGYGETIEKAIIDLNFKVFSFLNDDGVMDYFLQGYHLINKYLFVYNWYMADYYINDIFIKKNFPEWLYRFSTITKEKLLTLEEELKDVK